MSEVTCSGATAELPGWNETGLGFGSRWSAPIVEVDTGYAVKFVRLVGIHGSSAVAFNGFTLILLLQVENGPIFCNTLPFSCIDDISQP